MGICDGLRKEMSDFAYCINSFNAELDIRNDVHVNVKMSWFHVLNNLIYVNATQ